MMRLALLAVLLVVSVWQTPTSAESCQVVVVGGLANAWDVNDHLQVIGQSGGEAFLWQPEVGLQTLGVIAAGRLHINNHGIVAGMRVNGTRLEPFAWVNGQVLSLPTPPGDTIVSVLRLTDNNIVLMQGTRSWAVVGTTLYDLSTLTGASIVSLNEMGMLGGVANSQPYLRYWDGRILRPWTGPIPVQQIGAGGHFAGSPFTSSSGHQLPWYYGEPDGTVSTVAPFGLGESLTIQDINRRGDVVGSFVWGVGAGRRDYRPFLFRHGRFQGEFPDWVSANGINDLGTAMVGTRAGSKFGPFGPPGPPFRAELQICPPPVPQAPAAPWRLVASVSGQKVTLSWEGSVGATDYILEAGSAPGLSNVFNASVGRVLTISGEVPPGDYYAQVRARNAVGVSEPSSGVLVIVH